MTGRLDVVAPNAVAAHVREHGCAVFRAPAHDPRAVLELVSSVGEPIRVFPAPELWRPISVKPEKHPNRSEGVGESPLHMDFVNADNPPDYVCLLCLRSDPLGGGATVLAPTDVWHALPDRHVERLAQAIFTDGHVVGLSNVGRDINPFRVINNGAYWNFRYTRNLLASDHDPATAEALRCLTGELDRARLTAFLRPGDAIVFDQHRWVHGKTVLGAGQDELDVTSRRLLLQSFYRDRMNPLA